MRAYLATATTAMIEGRAVAVTLDQANIVRQYNELALQRQQLHIDAERAWHDDKQLAPIAEALKLNRAARERCEAVLMAIAS